MSRSLSCCVQPLIMSNSLTPWTVAHQAPLSMGFPSKDTGGGCHFLLQCALYIRIWSCYQKAEIWSWLYFRGRSEKTVSRPQAEQGSERITPRAAVMRGRHRTSVNGAGDRAVKRADWDLVGQHPGGCAEDLHLQFHLCFFTGILQGKLCSS